LRRSIVHLQRSRPRRSRLLARGEITTGVFVNCPFDAEYRPLFEAVVFAVHACGFVARSALEVTDSSEVRLDKICRLIRDCDLSVHDISRTELDAAHGLPRFNMPFELGLALGETRFGRGRAKLKRFLIMDVERHRYQKFISDIAGQDISAHDGDSHRAIDCVRRWLASVSIARDVPGTKHIVNLLHAFQAELPSLATELRADPDELEFAERRKLILRWLQRGG